MNFKHFIKEEPMWHGDRNNVFLGGLSIADQAKVKAAWAKAKLNFKKSSQQPDSYDFNTPKDLQMAGDLAALYTKKK